MSLAGVRRFSADETGVIMWLLGMKLLFALVILLDLMLLPGLFNWSSFLGNFHWPQTIDSSWNHVLKTWDTNHYLFVSEVGYQPGRMSNAMFPLWPYVMRVGHFLFGGYLLSGLVLSNLFSLIAMFLFYRLVAARYDQGAAQRALILLLAFPGSLYYYLPYTESLFLLLTVLFFLALEKKRFVLAALVAFCCGLTKAMGIFLFLPFSYQLWCSWRKGELPIAGFLLSPAPIAGYGSVTVILYYATGSTTAYYDALSRYITQASVYNLLKPLKFAAHYVDVTFGHSLFNSPFDRVWFIFVVVGLSFLFRMDKLFFIYALPMGIFPAVTASFVSYTRYVAVIFPLFIVFGVLSARPGRRRLYWGTVLTMAVIQVFFIILHINSYWVA